MLTALRDTVSCFSLCDPPKVLLFPFHGKGREALHAACTFSISGNQPAFMIVEEQLVINIPGWSVCGYRRTQRTGGHPADIPSLSPQFARVHRCASFLPLSDPPAVCLPPLHPSLGPRLCASFLLLWTSAASQAFTVSWVFFPLPVSPPVICLPLSLPELSDLAFNSSLFRSLPLRACLYGSPSTHTSPPSLSDCKCSNK